MLVLAQACLEDHLPRQCFAVLVKHKGVTSAATTASKDLHLAVSPPSITIVSPVMKSEAGEAR
jgi:hypothetical protein